VSSKTTARHREQKESEGVGGEAVRGTTTIIIIIIIIIINVVSCLLLLLLLLLGVGRDSSVGIETRYGLDGPGIESRWERDFPHLSRPASYTMGTGCLPVAKRPGRSFDHPPHLAQRLNKD
jgi:hypothetical protein